MAAFGAKSFGLLPARTSFGLSRLLLASSLRGAACLAPLCTQRRGLCAVLTPVQRDLRQRERSALQTLERALVKLEASPEHTELLRESVTLLDSLFLCCVVGEFNAGKSALINALLGRSWCVEGVLPTTASVCLLKHPDVPFEPLTAHGEFAGVGGAAGLSVINVPGVEWLRSLHLVDTPGTNSIDEAHTMLTNGFLPRADLVLFVTSSERPFSESEQSFLHDIAGWGKQVMMICLPPQGTPPPHTAADMAHSTHSTQPALRPHRTTPKTEDKPPQTRRPHSNGLCSPLSEGPDLGSGKGT